MWDLPGPGIERLSRHWQVEFLCQNHQGFILFILNKFILNLKIVLFLVALDLCFKFIFQNKFI